MADRSYDTPAAFKTALEARLRKAAQARGEGLSRARQLLVFDRLLARVFAELGDRVILKGGLVLEHRLERARTTRDIDLRITGRPDALLEQLRAAGRRETGDHLTFLVEQDPKHPTLEGEGVVYDGRRFAVECRLAGKLYGQRFRVDVAFADVLVGEPDVVPGSSLLEFVGIEPPKLRLYPRETHVAEKLHAYTLPRTTPNSRVKDLPDLALLAQTGPFDAATISKAIEATFTFRRTHTIPPSLPAPPDAWLAPYAKIAADDGLPWPSLSAVTSIARAFLDPVLAGQTGSWSPAAWAWGA